MNWDKIQKKIERCMIPIIGLAGIIIEVKTIIEIIKLIKIL